MITEGIVALIWAAAATCFFHENGMAETNAAVIVDAITKDWLGTIGGVLAILGVIAAPHYQRRYRFPFGTAYRCRFPGDGTKNDAPPFIYLHTDVFGCYRTVAVQPAR